MMDWNDLQVFLAAVRAGSYTAAGRRLDINRTTVGRRIDALEGALGVDLFNYSPAGPRPTEAGQRLLAAAEAMEREVDALRADLGAEPPRPGTIRLAVSAGLGEEFLPELLAFRRAHPAWPVELLGAIDPIEAVTQRRADLALALVRTPPRRLTGVQVAVLSQAPYARSDLPPDVPVLGWGHEFDAALPGGQWSAANPSGDIAEAAGLSTFNTFAQLKRAVLAGFGSAVMWCFCGDAEPSLSRLAPPNPRHDSPLWLLHRAKVPAGPALEALVAFLHASLPGRLAT